ncbi:efflux RND transporter permease subunit [bacterium]|nr:efflux RND transporter permease subunit [bacterium]
MSIVRLSVKNSVLVNMIMLVVFIFGIITLKDIPKEEMPAVDFGAFIIIVVYPGVSPSEIEELIIQKLEDELSDIQNLDYIQSTASEGRALISVNFDPDADIDKAWTDLNSELDKVTDLPEDARDPMLIRLNMREVNDMCDIVLGGDFSGNAIREIAENMREGLLDIPFVSKVDIAGIREREIWIEGDADKLDQFGLTLNDLINAINLRNMNVPGGTVNFGKYEFIIRTMGEFKEINEIASLIIRTDANARSVRVQDVAMVRDTLAEEEVISKLDGKQSVSLFVYKKEDGNIINVMKDIGAYVTAFSGDIQGLEAEIRNDDSIPVQRSLQVLGRSALFGIILVFLVLLVFLGWRKALFAAWGIPFSFLLTFVLLNTMDITLNTMSLFALVLVLGMIVDDAIIVLENVHRYMEKGLCPEEAVVKGANEIIWPVIAAVLTTIAAFIPMLIMEGMMGKFLRVFPIVVSLALLSSLFESLVILPSHIADFSQKKRDHTKRHQILQVLVKPYRKLLILALKHRLLTISLVFFAMILTLSIVGMRLVKFEFFPPPTPQTIILKLRTPVGNSLQKTNVLVSGIEEYLLNMEQKDDIEAIVSNVGFIIENYQWEMATSNAMISIDFVDVDRMKYGHEEIKANIRSYLDQQAELHSYNFDVYTEGAPTGKDIEIRVKGNSLERLEYIGDVLKAELNRLPGVVDLDDSFQPGKKEVKIIPDHEKLSIYGLNVAQIASLVRTASYGTAVSKFRGYGVDEYDIVVRLQKEQIDDLTDLENLKIRTITGDLVTLKDVARFEITTGYAHIEHRDKKRIITITGNTSFFEENGRKQKRTPDEVKEYLVGNRLTGTEGVFSNFEQRFPGYQLQFGGVVEEQQKSYRSLYKAFLIAVLLVFTILAAQFKSYVQPLIVMLTIPFGFIGVIFGLLITGLPFSLSTMISVVALSGVVVNDSLVLVDFVNRERQAGVDRWNSLINAGVLRLRPILLTTITTIIGLMPMILSRSRAVAEWKPMAVSIAFGLAFATLLTLFVIPVVYSLVDSIFGKLKITRFKEHKKFNECIEEL